MFGELINGCTFVKQLTNNNMTHFIFFSAFALYALLTLPKAVKETQQDFKHFNQLN